MASQLDEVKGGPATARGWSRGVQIMAAATLLGVSWAVMWSQDTFWNPLFFAGMWTGATLLMYLGGKNGYPGWRRHARLAAISIPIWWWFELVNQRVDNWQYVDRPDYSSIEYFIFASVAFSTVAPALDSAWRLTLSGVKRAAVDFVLTRRHYLVEALSGAGVLVLIFVRPRVFFPTVWVAPFLIIDGIVGYSGGRSIANDLAQGKWRRPAAIALAGLMCGFLWEFWNFWSSPKWIYDIPYLEFLHLFEMPLLGYLGYIPFVWSVHQLLQLGPFRRAL